MIQCMFNSVESLSFTAYKIYVQLSGSRRIPLHIETLTNDSYFVVDILKCIFVTSHHVLNQ